MANKQQTFKKALKAMQESWEEKKFILVPCKDIKYSTISFPKELQMLLDDQLIKTSTMKSSPFIGTLEAGVIEWDDKLQKISSTVDLLKNVQNSWMYLQPIFASEDFCKQMPKESKIFMEVNAQWSQLMTTSAENPDVLDVISQEELSDNLKQSESKLKAIEKGMEDFLETKRTAFPRFYFISNDDLLAICSNTKTPAAIQPYLKKCFEGINELCIDLNNMLTGMKSDMGDVVNFLEKINPADSNGQPELWLCEVEKAMRLAMRAELSQSIEEYPKLSLKDWIWKWQQQTVISTLEVYWTKEVEEAITNKNLEACAEKCATQIREISNMLSSDLSKSDRTKLESIIVVTVHAKDIVHSLMKKNVTKVEDFEWTAQLRHYWQDGDLYIKMMNTAVKYDYEYLGSLARLVITPLTDRCYRTLMGALKLNLGGSPQGPAGAGKTETCKDLGRILGKYCIVVSCSDQFDHISMEKIFKGVVTTGVWVIFDEFNRINIEVLSVVAEQLNSIQTAIAQKEETLVLGEKEVALNPGCGVFVTMNPGYAGRTELPEILKSMFRPVSMMVPDYALIAEIMLYYSGFQECKLLAQKLISCFKMCSERMSRQDSYDFGMRAVKAVLTQAGRLRRANPQVKEEVHLIRALIESVSPRFIPADLVLFDGVLNDLFCGAEAYSKKENLDLEAAIRSVLNSNNLESFPYFINKVKEIYNMMKIRHGICVIGEHMSGKSTALKVLAETLNLLSSEGVMDKSPVQYRILNPKSLTLDQFYGSIDPDSHQWKDGVFSSIFREYANSTSDEQKWIILDGPVDAVWVENLNILLDDNKALWLNGEKIRMSGQMHIIFEVEDLKVASPAFVSRNGVVNMHASQFGWRPLAAKFVGDISSSVSAEQKETIKMLLDWVLPQCLNFVQRNCKQLIECSEMHLTSNMVKLYKSMFDGIEMSDEKVITQFVFSLVWSVGAVLQKDSRIQFDKFLRDLIRDNHESKPTHLKLSAGALMPDSGTVYDFVFVDNAWVTWNSLVQKNSIPDDAKINELIIPTVETEKQKYFLHKFLEANTPVLFVGPTGTGKSLVINDYLKQLETSRYVTDTINLSSATSSDYMQERIMKNRNKCDEDQQSTKKVCLFLDNLNMPAKEVYGAQPPLELVRQVLDQGYCIDRESHNDHHVMNVKFVAAMGPPGGGRNVISGRILRHFNIIGVESFDDEMIEDIFTPIVDWHFSQGFDSWNWRNLLGFETGFSKVAKTIVTATKDVYQQVIENMLPSPTRPHYVFNLRDVSKVMQGVSLLKSSECPGDEAGGQKIMRLWAHELYRVFCDKLVDGKDKAWFSTILQKAIETHFNEQVEIEELENILFGGQCYDEIRSLSSLKQTMTKQLEQYNEKSDCPMNLVMFKSCMQHITRISRVLKQHNGHCMLVGIAGSGRQSAAKLAAFNSGCELTQVEITKSYNRNHWRADLKNLMCKTGVEGVPTVFLFSDNQIKEEAFLEDVCMLVENGDVANIFDEKEWKEIAEKMTAIAGKNNEVDMHQLFTERVKSNLHVVLTFTQVGHDDMFRKRLRMFPTLANNCAIDWFEPWSEDELQSVAESYLDDLDLDSLEKEKVVKMCRVIHCKSTELSQRFSESVNRSTYVTPCSYIHLLKVFKQSLIDKRSTLLATKNKYFNLLEKLKISNQEQASADTIQQLNELKSRWMNEVAKCSGKLDSIVGDLLLFTGYVTYLGPLEADFRKEALAYWQKVSKESGIAVCDNFTLSAVMDDAYTVRNWHKAGLPADEFSLDNAIISTFVEGKWPLMIDPQEQAKKWIKNKEANKDLQLTRPSDPNYLAKLENSIQFGTPCLIEDVEEKLDPILESLLLKQTFKQDNTEYIMLGDRVVEYSSDFLLYMTTSWSNPQFSPEVYANVTVINFTISPSNLEDQLLDILVMKERPDLDIGKIVDEIIPKWRLLEEQDKIVQLMCTSKETISTDTATLDKITYCNNAAKDLSAALPVLKVAKANRETFCSAYREVCSHSSAVIFAVEELANIDPMYKYSVEWFFNFFANAIENSEKCDDTKQRCENIKECFTYSIYENVCKSVFSKDRLMFSFILCTALQRKQGKINELEWRQLLTGGVTSCIPDDKPNCDWLTDRAWAEIVALSDLPTFKGLAQHFKAHTDHRFQWNLWREMSYSENLLDMKLPGRGWGESITPMQALMVVRCLQPDQVIPAVTRYVVEHMGQKYVEPPKVEISVSYEESAYFTPMLMLLSDGVEPPTASIQRLAAEKGRKLEILSLGQGKAPKMEQAIKQATADGNWVLLQNCHTGASTLPLLESLYRNIISDQSKTKASFRLWLTSYPTTHFPATVIKNSIKITLEPPKGLRDILFQTFSNIATEEFLETFSQEEKEFEVVTNPELEKVLAMLEAAKQNFASVKKINVSELKSYAAPPMLVIELMEVVCILLGKELNYKKLLSDANFLYRLKNFDKDNIRKDALVRLQRFVKQPHANVDAAKKVSAASAIIMEWVLAIHAYVKLGNLNTEKSEKPSREKAFKKMLFGLCFYHAVVIERRSFSALGWNIPYEFTNSDLKTCARQLQMLINEYEEVPMEALNYLVGECNYGGRISDDKDRRLAISLMSIFFNNDIMKDNYRFSPSGLYYAPKTGSRQSYLDYIEQLPFETNPEAFGLHESANIIKNENKAQCLFDRLLQAVSDKTLATDKSLCESVEKFSAVVLAKLPCDFDITEVQEKFPWKADPVNTVLVQELQRFNNLTRLIRSSLQNLQKAKKGCIVMTPEIEEIYNSLAVAKVPKMWLRHAYPTLKTLNGFISDLLGRLQYFKDWVDNGITPAVMRLSAFYFPQGYLSTVLQTYSRKHKVPFNELGFQFEIMSSERDIIKKPADGTYINGLYIEGARWDKHTHKLTESHHKVPYEAIPAIWLKPGVKATFNNTGKTYICPVYKTTARRGVLSTTGHSTNFVMMMDIPTDVASTHWVNRSVACFLQLND